MSSSVESLKLATPTQSEEIAEMITDICRNPDYAAITGIDTHVVIFSTNSSQLRVSTLVSPFDANGAVDCAAVSREQVESGEFSQLILQSYFLFLSTGIIRRKFLPTVQRGYYTLDHDADNLSAVSNPLIIPCNTPRHERKLLQAKKREIEALNAGVMPKEFLLSDYEKLKKSLGEFSVGVVLMCGEDASSVYWPLNARW